MSFDASPLNRQRYRLQSAEMPGAASSFQHHYLHLWATYIINKLEAMRFGNDNAQIGGHSGRRSYEGGYLITHLHRGEAINQNRKKAATWPADIANLIAASMLVSIW